LRNDRSCLRRTRVLVTATLGAWFISACALDPELNGEQASAGINITLTPIDAFGAGGTSTMMPGTGGAQLGYAAAVAASGGFVYVVDAASSALVRLDPARAEVRVLHPLKDPNTNGLHVSIDQVIEVVDRYNRAVVELDQSGWERRRFMDSQLIPTPVDVTRTNWGSTILIADGISQRLAMFDAMSNPTGLFTTTLSPVAVAASITAIAATVDSVFVLDVASREVTQLDMNGRPVATYGEDALLAPVALAVDECHRVFVADGHSGGLFISSPEFYGTNARAALPPEVAPAVTDLWIDGNTLYVAAGALGVHVMAVDPPCMGP
jgi:DNA-binding beta-propeller fold protein YncE